MKRKQPQRDQVKDLFISWLLGLFFGAALFISILIIAGTLLQGIFAFSDANPSNFQVLLILFLFFLTYLILPTLLGLYWSSLKNGLITGITTIVIGPIFFWIGWMAWGYLPIYLVSVFGTSLTYLYHYFQSLMPFFSSIGVISTIIILCTYKYSRQLISLSKGIFIGLFLTIIIEILYGKSLLYDDNGFHILWIIPPIVWVTVVYFVQRGQGQKSTKGLLTWIGLVVTSFILPLIISQTPLWLFR